MTIFGVKNSVKNWERIRKGEANDLLIASYNEAITENLMWLQSIRKTLEEIGMNEYFTKEYDDKNLFIFKKVFSWKENKCNTENLSTIKGNKLRTYALFKDEPGLENYLVKIKNTEHRRQVTKFRLSDHKLRIETGRFENISKENRFCPFCPNMIENEAHMLLACPIYKRGRKNLLDTVSTENPEFTSYTDDEKFVFLMKNISPVVAKYIYASLEIREFLVRKPKRHD